MIHMQSLRMVMLIGASYLGSRDELQGFKCWVSHGSHLWVPWMPYGAF